MKFNAPGQAVLAYHEVMPESNYSYCVTEGDFAGHLDLVRSCGAAAAKITFDDGEQSQMRYAGPLLAKHGLQATYFITPGLIGTAEKFLDWSQLRELQIAGHSIQSHGWSHRFLPACADKELEYELTASKPALEDRLGRAVEEISIPGGRWNNRVLRACAACGYKRVYISQPWIVALDSGVSVIGRFMVRRTTTLAELKNMIEMDRRTLHRLKVRSQVRSALVSVLGDDRYHRLWRRLTGYNEFEEARRQQSYS